MDIDLVGLSHLRIFQSYAWKQYNLNQFEKCIDLGIESTGFLSSEHFYFGDGIKITKHCTQWEEQITNKTHIEWGMRCEETN